MTNVGGAVLQSAWERGYVALICSHQAHDTVWPGGVTGSTLSFPLTYGHGVLIHGVSPK